jgi:hypothetical protein
VAVTGAVSIVAIADLNEAVGLISQKVAGPDDDAHNYYRRVSKMDLIFPFKETRCAAALPGSLGHPFKDYRYMI